jgi:hypothetical protein
MNFARLAAKIDQHMQQLAALNEPQLAAHGCKVR